MLATRGRAPTLLVTTQNGGPGGEVAELAARHGYVVSRAAGGTQALEQAHARPPDLIVLDESLSDMEVFDTSRALRDDPHVGAGTPLLLITTQRPSSPQHHDALRAGVWEFLRHPFKPGEIPGKLDAYVIFKRDADYGRRENGIADASGFYTVRGLALRGGELTLQAFHHAQPLACVALAPLTPSRVDQHDARTADRLAGVLRAAGRRSDAIGRLGPGEFAIIAPGTDKSGAVRLAERFARSFTAAGLRAGYDAVGNARYTPVEPKYLLARATTALRAAKGLSATDWIQGFKS